MPKTKIAIACQGGGTHTAFTAGALKHLLENDIHSKHQIVGLTGTSGGAVCATAALYGLLKAANGGTEPPYPGDPGSALRWTIPTTGFSPPRAPLPTRKTTVFLADPESAIYAGRKHKKTRSVNHNKLVAPDVSYLAVSVKRRC